MGKYDTRYEHFIDNLLLRLWAGDQRRTHFPIVYSSTNSRFFVNDVMTWMHAELYQFGFVDLRKYSFYNYLDILGDSWLLSTTASKFVRFATMNPIKFAEFMELLSKEPLEKRIDMREVHKKTKNYKVTQELFNYRMTRALANPLLRDYADQDQWVLRRKIAQLFMKMNALRRKHSVMILHKHEEEFEEDLIIKTLVIEEILYASPVMSQITYSDLQFAEFAHIWAKKQLAKTSILKKITFAIRFIYNGYDLHNTKWRDFFPYYERKERKLAKDLEFGMTDRYRNYDLNHERLILRFLCRARNNTMFFYDANTEEKIHIKEFTLNKRAQSLLKEKAEKELMEQNSLKINSN